MKSLKGTFLISNSTLKEENFNETVVLIIDHNRDGAFGLIVNRLLDHKKLGDLLPGLQKKAAQKRIYEGGPVRQEVLFVLYSDESENFQGTEIIPGVYMSNNYDYIEIFAQDEIPFHIYQGYAGWAPGQLESELAGKTWAVIPATREIVFHQDPHQVWREALMHGGGIFSYFSLNVKDPFLN